MANPNLPKLVVAADWSVHENRRRMVRAALDEYRKYVVSPPEPVGEIKTLLHRLRSEAPGAAIVGFDFPLGLPQAYASQCGIESFRDALASFGSAFFDVTDFPSLRQPFYPSPTQEKGKYSKAALAQALGVHNLSALLRTCDRKTAQRGAAEVASSRGLSSSGLQNGSRNWSG